ncbi:hypothetical protein A1O1_06064 [Capronia coronata CBS 617.96]|uniref:Uncharacterized protein n=1 Tax=Capronia coronata CBS 617.96 TaxID=1182541 RepID=W9Y8X4_9EURO|nr:uncharacterized protein A1O1_06064 [Capronia coronata CBS 617.96]EXJ85696.1 hypothetical protein A1O1_06064 [Capronia coronata CBS 617.96]
MEIGKLAFKENDKRVAVIGAASNGTQVVPVLLSPVKGRDHHVRGKTWVSNQFSGYILKNRVSDDGSTKFVYSEQEKEHWNQNWDENLAYKKSLEFRLQGNHESTQTNSIWPAAARKAYAKNMRQRLPAKPDISEHLIPNFPPLCKGLTPRPGYLEALTAANVNVIRDSILSVEEYAVATVDGVRRPVDAIVSATGLETSPSAGFPITVGTESTYARNCACARPVSRRTMSTYGQDISGFGFPQLSDRKAGCSGTSGIDTSLGSELIVPSGNTAVSTRST